MGAVQVFDISSHSSIDSENDINNNSNFETNHSFDIESESESEKNKIMEENSVQSTQTDVTTKTRKTNNWLSVAKFNTYIEAHEYLQKEGFRHHGYKDGKDGRKTNYHCNKIKQCAKKQCEAKRRIFECASTTDFEIQEADCAHTCMSNPDSDHSIKISEEMKNMVIECSTNRMTAKNTIKHIESLKSVHKLFPKENVPNESQIYYILRSHKNANAPKMLYLGQLIEWCEAHSEPPEDIDEPFVIGLENCEDNVQSASFRIVVSTKRL